MKLFGKILLIDSTLESCKPLELPTSTSTCDYEWSGFSDRSPSAESKSDLLCPQMRSDNSDNTNVVPFPWLTIYNDASYMMLEVHTPTPVRAQPLCNKREKPDSGDEEKEKIFSSYKLSRGVLGSSPNSRRGFVPYKRCLAEQDSTISSKESGEETENQRIRLCL